jgi:hypothetical protein
MCAGILGSMNRLLLHFIIACLLTTQPESLIERRVYIETVSCSDTKRGVGAADSLVGSSQRKDLREAHRVFPAYL